MVNIQIAGLQNADRYWFIFSDIIMDISYKSMCRFQHNFHEKKCFYDIETNPYYNS